MIERTKLKQEITNLLSEKNIVWLSGVRRVGKTTLCKSLVEDGGKYLDCELPSIRAQIEDPEFFWKQQGDNLVVLDEVHRLPDPSNVLKIAADHFPKVKVVATGSSTLSARRKFKDTLTDRKRTLWMQPLLASEIKNESGYNLERRLLRGGLPPAYLSPDINDTFYSEWLDAFWAKDVQELFAIDKKTNFLKLAEMILRQSGEMFEASSFAGPCEISRQTVTNYLEILSITLFAIVVRPFSNKRANDIVSAPKVYGFDTGFVCFTRGWFQLRPEDMGGLIEHLVLSELIANVGKENIYYWRDKQGHEIDFVIKPSRGREVHTVECKLNHKNFDTRNLRAFRNAYPHGKNFLYAANVDEPTPLKIGDKEVLALPLGSWV
ncbi:MAG: ATP-binding protein [Oligoflexales bacterium]